MKKFRIISIIMILVLLLSACGDKKPEETPVKDPAETPAQTGTVQPQTPDKTEPVTPPPAVQTPEVQKPDDEYSWYRSLQGTWLVYEGEIEGYRYDAVEADVCGTLEFFTYGACYRDQSVESPSRAEYFYDLQVEDGAVIDGADPWHLVLDSDWASEKKTISTKDGELIMSYEYKDDFGGGGELFFRKIDAPLAARVTQMEATSYNTTSDGKFTFEPGWYTVIDSVSLQPVDMSDTMNWEIFTFEEDDVHVYIESNYTGTDYFAMIMDGERIFVRDKTVYKGVFHKGESLAVMVSSPDKPDYRICLSKGEYWGSYEFKKSAAQPYISEDYPMSGGYYAGQMGRVLPITLHNKETERRTTRSAKVSDATRFLEGCWVYKDDNGFIKAILKLDHNGNLTAYTDTYLYEMSYYLDRVFAEDNEPSDTICLWTNTDSLAAQHFGMSENVGDYYFEVYPTENEEILAISQVNNGDGILGNMLTGYDDDRFFVFHRYEGTCRSFELRTGTFVGNIVRYDVDNWKVWVQPQAVIDHDEQGGNLWASDGTPVLPYEPKDSTTLYPLFYSGTPSIEYPMLLCNIEADGNGCIVHIEE